LARQANLLNRINLICPTGWQAIFLSSPFAKIFLFRPEANQFTESHRPVPIEGRFAIVTNAGRDAVDAAARETNAA
jgi:hypothetical protein